MPLPGTFPGDAHVSARLSVCLSRSLSGHRYVPALMETRLDSYDNLLVEPLPRQGLMLRRVAKSTFPLIV